MSMRISALAVSISKLRPISAAAFGLFGKLQRRPRFRERLLRNFRGWCSSGRRVRVPATSEFTASASRPSSNVMNTKKMAVVLHGEQNLAVLADRAPSVAGRKTARKCR
jgi:hypothetical protein